MSCELFIPYKPQESALKVIDQANEIISEYLDQNFKLTLRQLFYQFVARDLLENERSEYARLCTVINKARDGGMVDWEAIEDRTREVHNHASWDGPANRIASAARTYRVDPWKGQRYRPEVWVEKEALLGVIEDVSTEYRVAPYFAHRGNNSMTLQHQAGKRFAEHVDRGRIPIVLHLADHDPNGLDMTRDIRQRLALYARQEIEVRRIALNMDQIREHKPPPNFGKETDTRFAAYVKEVGSDECWELDALSPTVIVDLIRTELDGMIDQPAWSKALAREKRERKLLNTVATQWTEVEKFVKHR